MARELEAKFKVEQFRSVRRALRDAKGIYLGTVMERDTFFDTAKRDLYRSGQALRLRQIRVLKHVAGGRKAGWLVTSKGPVQPGSVLKDREELQTSVDDGLAMADILQLAGLLPCQSIEKRRASYRLGRCSVELDEVPRLARFVEIEGPSYQAIEAVRRKLNLPDEPVTTSYLEMVADMSHRRSGNADS